MGNSEKDLLVKIANYFELENSISTYNNKHLLRIAATGIKEFFSSTFNIPIKNKTFELSTPNTFTNSDCLKAYILGCLDGDGCISHLSGLYPKPTVVLTTASEDFVKNLINII